MLCGLETQSDISPYDNDGLAGEIDVFCRGYLPPLILDAFENTESSHLYRTMCEAREACGVIHDDESVGVGKLPYWTVVVILYVKFDLEMPRNLCNVWKQDCSHTHFLAIMTLHRSI